LNIFKRSVDLFEEKALKNTYFIKTVNQSKNVDVRNRIIHGYDSVSDDVV
jgi:uncharacterized protein with HEPN domain